jgi:hypothetical protein
MNTATRTIPLLIILASLLVGYLSMRCGITSSCPFAVSFSDLAFSLFKPLWIFSLFSIPVGVVLTFARRDALKTWFYFTAWWIPLSVVFVAMTVDSHSWMPLFDFGKSEAAILMSSLFTIISLGIIGWKQFRSRK